MKGNKGSTLVSRQACTFLITRMHLALAAVTMSDATEEEAFFFRRAATLFKCLIELIRDSNGVGFN